MFHIHRWNWAATIERDLPYDNTVITFVSKTYRCRCGARKTKA